MYSAHGITPLHCVCRKFSSRIRYKVQHTNLDVTMLWLAELKISLAKYVCVYLLNTMCMAYYRMHL